MPQKCHKIDSKTQIVEKISDVHFLEIDLKSYKKRLPVLISSEKRGIFEVSLSFLSFKKFQNQINSIFVNPRYPNPLKKDSAFILKMLDDSLIQLIHSKIRILEIPERIEKLVFCYYLIKSSPFLCDYTPLLTSIDAFETPIPPKMLEMGDSVETQRFAQVNLLDFNLSDLEQSSLKFSSDNSGSLKGVRKNSKTPNLNKRANFSNSKKSDENGRFRDSRGPKKTRPTGTTLNQSSSGIESEERLHSMTEDFEFRDRRQTTLIGSMLPEMLQYGLAAPRNSSESSEMGLEASGLTESKLTNLSYFDAESFADTDTADLEGSSVQLSGLSDFYTGSKSGKSQTSKSTSHLEMLLILSQLTSYLSSLHHLGVFQGGLHPSNIMITSNRLSEPFVVLGNYLLKTDLKGPKTSTEGFDGGEAASIDQLKYLAPEILLENRVSEKSDLWSMGCVLYEFFEKRSVFDVQEVSKLKFKMSIFVFESLKFEKCHSEVKSILSLLLRREPRYRTTCAKLARYLKGQISLDDAKGKGGPEKAKKVGRRNNEFLTVEANNKRKRALWSSMREHLDELKHWSARISALEIDST